MGVNIQTINLTKYKNKLLGNTEKVIQEVTSNIFIDVKKFSPISSGTYVSNHKYLGVKREGLKIVGIVENSGLYSERVEYGFRKEAVNWNIRNMGQIYNSKGASVYARAILKNKSYFINKLQG